MFENGYFEVEYNENDYNLVVESVRRFRIKYAALYGYYNSDQCYVPGRAQVYKSISDRLGVIYASMKEAQLQKELNEVEARIEEIELELAEVEDDEDYAGII